MAKILLVEDDEQFAESLASWLRQRRHAVDVVGGVKHGYNYASTGQYDILLLDWELPDGSGFELCDQLKKDKIKSPVIILTGRTAIQDKIAGLDCGADDYATKPCEPEELMARIRALLRRSIDPERTCFAIDSIRLDLTARSVQVDNTIIPLSPGEFDVLHLLMRNPGTVMSTDALLVRLSGDNEWSRSVLKVFISSIRKKFKNASKSSPINFRDGGYVFERHDEVD